MNMNVSLITKLLHYRKKFIDNGNVVETILYTEENMVERRKKRINTDE